MSDKPSLAIYGMSYFLRFASGITNRNWFIYQELSRLPEFDKIIYIDFLPFNWRSFLRSLYYLCIKKDYQLQAYFFGSALYQLDKKCFLIISPIHFLSETLFLKQLEKYLKLLAIKEIWSWSYNPLETTFLDKRLFKRVVFEAVDDWRFHSIYCQQGNLIEENYKLISQEADVIFTVSEYLKHIFLKQFKAIKLKLVPNTTNINCSNDQLILPKNNRPKIVYLGTVESRFDVELFTKLVKDNPNYDFFIIGPIWREKKYILKQFLTLPNVFIKSAIPLVKISTTLSDFNAAIIPHKIFNFSISNDSLKIYDCLAVGLPVVTTVKTATPLINQHLYFVDQSKYFSSILRHALNKDSTELRRKRALTVKQFTWKEKALTMTKYITEKT